MDISPVLNRDEAHINDKVSCVSQTMAVGPSTLGNYLVSTANHRRTGSAGEATEPSTRVHRIFNPAPPEGPDPSSIPGRIRIREQPNSTVGGSCKSTNWHVDLPAQLDDTTNMRSSNYVDEDRT